MKTNSKYSAGQKVNFLFDGKHEIELLQALTFPHKGLGNLWVCRVPNTFPDMTEDSSEFQVLTDYFFAPIGQTPTNPDWENSDIAFLTGKN